MTVRAIQPAFQHTERSIQVLLYWQVGIRRSRKLTLPNVYVFENESDLLTLTKAGYVDEYEIKISRSDFLADQRKDRHVRYQHLSPWRWQDAGAFRDEGMHCTIAPGALYPNRFWYVVPEGLVQEPEVPTYAGLLWVTPNRYLRTIRPAPKLHDRKAPEHIERRMLESAYHRFCAQWARDP